MPVCADAQKVLKSRQNGIFIFRMDRFLYRFLYILYFLLPFNCCIFDHILSALCDPPEFSCCYFICAIRRHMPEYSTTNMRRLCMYYDICSIVCMRLWATNNNCQPNEHTDRHEYIEHFVNMPSTLAVCHDSSRL